MGRRRTSEPLDPKGTRQDEGEVESAHTKRPRLLNGEPLSSKLRWYAPPRRKYTRRELLADRIVNFGGAGTSWLAAPVLAYTSWSIGDSFAKQVGFWAFGAGLIVMLTCSAAYHFLCWRWEIADQLYALDHIGISSMIMGAYVPVMQMVGAWKTLAVVLMLGFLGWAIEAYKYIAASHHLNAKSGFSFLDSLHVVRYLVMGWACLCVGPSMWHVLPGKVMALCIAGGVTYSLGVPIWIQYEMEFHLPIWHSAVVVASFCFYASIWGLIGLPLEVVKS